MTRAVTIRLARASLGLALLLAAAPARAEVSAEARAQAANFFDAGAQAYEAGQYLVAAEAFLKAHELLPSPALLFSAAQAYRRQYLTDPSPESLRRAVSLYRDYLRADAKAKRREEAVEALGVLVPIEARLSAPPAAVEGAPGEGEGRTARLIEVPGSAPAGDGGARTGSASAGPARPATAAARSTRLLLTASPDSAQISLDGGPFQSPPVVATVAPGEHRVHVRAQGYHDEQLTVRAVANELMPRHVPLRPRPARLRITGTAGARVAIDGQARATVPTAAPLAIEPGAHVVTVTQKGREPYSQQIELGRDQETALEVQLPPTPQRIAAWATLSVGAAGAVASGVLAGLALAQQGTAVELRDKREAGVLSLEERDRYNQASAARDDLAVAAAITGGAAALTLITGVGLFMFDEPEVPPLGERPEAPPRPAPRTELTVGALSLGVRGTF